MKSNIGCLTIKVIVDKVLETKQKLKTDQRFSQPVHGASLTIILVRLMLVDILNWLIYISYLKKSGPRLLGMEVQSASTNLK